MKNDGFNRRDAFKIAGIAQFELKLYPVHAYTNQVAEAHYKKGHQYRGDQFQGDLAFCHIQFVYKSLHYCKQGFKFPVERISHQVSATNH